MEGAMLDRKTDKRIKELERCVKIQLDTLTSNHKILEHLHERVEVLEALQDKPTTPLH